MLLRLSMLLLVLIAAAPTAHAQERAWTPSEITCAAARDLAAVEKRYRCHVRYLYLNPHWNQETLAWLLSYHVNSMSTEAGIAVPEKVADAPLLRINVCDYGPQWLKVWEQLAAVEPFYHLTIVEVTESREYWKGGYDPEYGKTFEAGWYKKRVRKKVAGFAPWVKGDKKCHEAALYLSAETGSQVPLADGAWFLWQTAIQADRSPGYYDFLGIKDQDDYERLIGFDAKLAKNAKRVEHLEAVALSAVTLQPRRIGVFDAISGKYYQTFDNRLAKDDRNPLRVLDGKFKFDATEVIGHLPCDLIVWGLFDAQRKRQDSAPDFIASDSTAHGTDRRVHVNASCIRCHGPDDGIRPVDGWVRGLYHGKIKLQDPDHDKERLLKQQYLRDLDEPLEEGRRKYRKAVAKATGGRTPAELAAAFANLFGDYDGEVTVERAAADVGMETKAFVRSLEEHLKTYRVLDPSLAIFLSDRKKVYGPIQWHEAFPLAMLATRGYAAVPKKE